MRETLVNRRGVASLCGAVVAITILAMSIGTRYAEAGDVQLCTGIAALENVSYSVSPDAGGPRSRYVATLRNDGLCPIEYGNPFWIEVRDGNGWRPLTHGRRCVFTMEGHLLRPGGSASQRVGWLNSHCDYKVLEPGLYRVSKDIRTEANPAVASRSRTIRALFEVAKDR